MDKFEIKTSSSAALKHPADAQNRIEGRLKVTGAAQYAAEYPLENMTYGVMVTSRIARGSIKSIQSDKASGAAGVLTVISHLNRPRVPGYDKPVDQRKTRYYGQEYRLFYDNRIMHHNQPVALVVAETLEQATFAASLVEVVYDKEQHQTDLLDHLSNAVTPHRPTDSLRGNADAWRTAEVSIEEEYHTPIQVHNSMEPHATTAHWLPSGKLIIYNKTQFVQGTKDAFINYFNLEKDQVEVNAPFVGGAFGSASRVWPHEMAAVMGAKVIGRPLKVAMERKQVFNMIGYRPYAVQKFSIGATKKGIFVGIRHEAKGMTSVYEEFVERITDPTKSMYRCPNLQTSYQLVPLDVSTPTHARGPGETTGSFALESAVDELAYALKIDPVKLRIMNLADTDPEKNIPWTSNHLEECYREGSRIFGWEKRNPIPSAMTSEGYMLGMGMSAGIYKATREASAASAQLNADGSYTVKTSVADTGPGSATVFAQIAAERLGTDIRNVRFLWGNSSLPPAPGQFGSHTTASVGSAVHDVCMALTDQVINLALKGAHPGFKGRSKDEIVVQNGFVQTKNGLEKISCKELLKTNQLPELLVTKESKAGPEEKTHSGKSFCANFVEVLVHPLTGVVRINRVVTVVDCGKVINHKTAESQVYGSVVWGIGVALMEEGIIDHRTGGYINNNLADYHLPVCADIPDITVKFIDKDDSILDPVGAKGLGEIGMIGFSAAVANAVFHATGKRIRHLPITPDKLI
ncbi:MAG: xanthine dehydrogenase family protein molybdopterin-binding subunit [Pedobacter sp.]|uniref:xanthine dehydrogenase family protein molybdopterin-binding subunit n=1 Tax=Pedobacter sp. TaxID=1411316 RepID=UPI00339A7903